MGVDLGTVSRVKTTVVAVITGCLWLAVAGVESGAGC